MTTESGPPTGSHAVLIGVSAYEHAEFPPIRATRNSLQAMRELLSGPGLCGWPPERVTVIANPLSAPDLTGQVTDLTEITTGVLLLYYVGHGALTARGELYPQTPRGRHCRSGQRRSTASPPSARHRQLKLY